MLAPQQTNAALFDLEEAGAHSQFLHLGLSAAFAG